MRNALRSGVGNEQFALVALGKRKLGDALFGQFVAKLVHRNGRREARIVLHGVSGFVSRAANLINSHAIRALERRNPLSLDELPEMENVSVGLFRLLVESERTAGEAARRLVGRASKTELDLIEQILSYKFNALTRQEVREMLGIQEELLKDTAFYREAFEEGRAEGEAKGRAEGERATKLAVVPLLRRLGLSDEQIAKELNLSLADVQSVPKASA
ncbi:MAG: DUF2887 domain-containing protein [Chloroherpetonaceae bacterium]|nr:DUF2887 domain-containing protein [Chloroherpetonaceae bacterium]